MIVIDLATNVSDVNNIQLFICFIQTFSLTGGSGRQVYSNAPSIQGDTEVTGEEGITQENINSAHTVEQYGLQVINLFFCY